MSEWIAPAPWSQDKYGSIVDGNGVGVRFRGVSTLCSGAEQAIAEAEANTTLAAAAPDLLEALDGMIKAYDDGAQPEWALPYIHAAHAALAKARGTPC